MKPVKENPNSIETQGIKKTVKFGIKSSGLAHIFNVLRNQLYSDKVLAVIREYSTNAVDAHVEVKQADRPIEVTIPNSLNPYFKVRDFGCALTDKDIQEIYAFYGESTKRNTNEQTGMLGIGSKAAFAYGDNFVINSFIDGEKHIHNAFIDPSQVGQISKLGTEKTDEENGVEIVVPVRSEDVSEFAETAEGLFKWFKVKPIVKGVAQFEYTDKKTIFSGEGWTWVEGTRSRYGYNHNDCIAVMGNIGYPIRVSDLNLSADDEKDLIDLVSENLVMEFNIGDLEISASREKLQYTDFTRKNVTKKLRQIADEIADKVMEQFNECKTLFAAKCLHGQIFDYGNGLYGMRNVLEKKITFKGKPVTDDQFSLYSENGDVLVHKLKKPNRGTRMRLEEQHSISCNASTVIVENDFKDNRGILGRLLPLAIDEEKTVYLVRFKSKKTRKQTLKTSGLDSKMPLASTLEKKAITHYYPTAASHTNSKGKRIVSKTFTLDFDSDRYVNKKSDYWKPAEVDFDNDKGLYVVIDRFEVVGVDDSGSERTRFGYNKCPHSYIRLKKLFKETFDLDLPPIYGIKKAQASKMEDNDNWTHLSEYLQEQIQKEVSANDMVQQIVDHHEVCSVKSENFYDSDFRKVIAPLVAVQDGDFATFYQMIAQMEISGSRKKRIDELREVANKVGIEFDTEGTKATVRLVKMSAALDKKYPLIEMLDSYGFRCKLRHGGGDVQRDALIQYIDMIDLTNQKSVL